MKTPQCILDLSEELDKKMLLRDWHFVEMKGILGFKLSINKKQIIISIADDENSEPDHYWKLDKNEFELFFNFIRYLSNSSTSNLHKIFEMMET